MVAIVEWPHGKTSKVDYVPSEDSDQTEHMHSLIKVFAVCLNGS